MSFLTLFLSKYFELLLAEGATKIKLPHLASHSCYLWKIFGLLVVYSTSKPKIFWSRIWCHLSDNLGRRQDSDSKHSSKSITKCLRGKCSVSKDWSKTSDLKIEMMRDCRMYKTAKSRPNSVSDWEKSDRNRLLFVCVTAEVQMCCCTLEMRNKSFYDPVKTSPEKKNLINNFFFFCTWNFL